MDNPLVRAIRGGNTTSISFPIGYVYISVDPTDPSTYFGGTWERLQNVFLFGASDTHAAGETGGEEEHLLTVDELPSHDHKIWQRNSKGYENGGRIVMDSTYYNNTAYYSTVDFAVSKTGGDLPHNNMPPYLAVYMWKRIA